MLRYAKSHLNRNTPIRVKLSHQMIRIGAEGFSRFYVLRGARLGIQQRDLHALVSDLGHTPLSLNPVLKTLHAAFSGEIYDAFEAFFAWMLSDTPDVPSCVFTWKQRDLIKGAEGRNTCDGALPAPMSREGETPRSLIIEGLWLYFHTWKHNLRKAPEEAIALALSKYYGAHGNYARALHFVDHALKSACSPIHLKSAEYALHLKISGKPVPPRLEKFIGHDNGYLKDFVCSTPFKRFDIVETGDVNVCCGHWLPTSIGRIEQGSLDEILNSGRAQQIRKTMTDGTYKYCNHLDCRPMAENDIPHRDALTDPVMINAVANQDFKVDRVDDMLFAYDQSCNLACPSCRKERIIERPSDNEAKARIMEEKLLPLLRNLRHIMLNVAGEVFSSKPSRKILEMISPETCPDLEIDLISNGTLFTEAEWNKYPGIHGKVRGVRISIDAARKETFEKLRRFGIFEVLTQNLAFLKRLREQEIIKDLLASFTYQVDNFHEMEEFVHFTRAFGFDRVIFEPLQNVGAFTDQQFRDRAVHKPSHPQFQEFLAMIQRPVFRQGTAQGNVSHDFANYEGFEPLTASSEPVRAAG